MIAVPLDRPLAATAAGIAADHRLRGADAVYVAVALRFGTVLLTRDEEQRRRVTSVVRTVHPDQIALA